MGLGDDILRTVSPIRAARADTSSRPTVIQTIPSLNRRSTALRRHTCAARVVLPKPPAPVSPAVSATEPSPDTNVETSERRSNRLARPSAVGT
jgi:hypothetical protein